MIDGHHLEIEKPRYLRDGFLDCDGTVVHTVSPSHYAPPCQISVAKLNGGLAVLTKNSQTTVSAHDGNVAKSPPQVQPLKIISTS